MLRRKRMLLSLYCLFLVIGTGLSEEEDSSGMQIPTTDLLPSLTLTPTLMHTALLTQSIGESAFPRSPYSSVYITTPSMSVSSVTVASQYLSSQLFVPSSVYSSEQVLTSSPQPIVITSSLFSNAVQSTEMSMVQSSPEFVIAPQSRVNSDLISLSSSDSVESTANPEMSVIASSTPIIGVKTTTTTVSTPPTMSPTDPDGGSNTGILAQIEEFFSNSTFTIVVAVGGSCILLLLSAIFFFCCCFCCCRRKGHYTIENSTDNADITVGNRYRRNTATISDPIPSYKMALRNVQAQRQQLEDFVETELGPDSKADDVLHYQGHSQVQHSQPYSPVSPDTGTSQSLSKLTPFNTSQMISQARGGISVDDIEEEIPEKDGQVASTAGTRADGGGDSPFMHLSDNLTGSRGRISQRSSSDPHTDMIGNAAQPSQASQYSHLGLGVLHGGDVVFTNTASLAEDMHSSIGMIGIDQSLLLLKDSDLHSHRTASPLLVETSADLDETPVREKPLGIPGNQKLKGLTSLTSLTSLEPTKIPRSSTTTDEPGKKLNLSLITSLNSSPEKSERGLTHSDNMHSNLQETPERYRRHTVESSAFKRHPGKSPQSRLGKLTSLEYIRASLRMKLNRIKGSEENDTKKKPLKSAMRKTSFNSQNSSPDSANSSRNNSFIYSNTHAFSHHNDVSPQHQLPPAGPHYGHPTTDPYLRSPNLDDFPLVGMPGNIESGYGPMSGMYPPGPGYPRGDPYMMALSPPAGGYVPEPLSPILSVSQFDHPGIYPAHEIGILPQYGNRMHPSAAMMGGYHDQAFPPKPPHYDDDDFDDDDIPALHSPYRTPGDQGGGASQRNVTWNLETVEISVDPENLTPSDIDDDLR